ncbi:hypothetical protein G6F37_004850 [Rhizopus arrhizus]|nr:hypothetical protein G6F37_004850 [Rhizopus arrhizus]
MRLPKSPAVGSIQDKTLAQAKERPYQAGQLALVFNQPLSTKKKSNKLMFDWHGLYKAQKVKSKLLLIS